MRTRRSNYPNNSNVTIPRRRRRQVSNIVEPEIRTIVAPMAKRTMEELLRAPTKGYREAIVLPEINADHFEIKTNLLQLVQANPFYGSENDNPYAHINSFKRITSTLRFRNVPNDVIKLMMFSYSLEGAAKTWLKRVVESCGYCGGCSFWYNCPATEPNQASVCAVLRIVSKPSSTLGIFETQFKPEVERETEETTDKEQTNFQGSTAQIPPPVIPISVPEPDVLTTLPKITPILESDIPKSLPYANIHILHE
ncbi:hypothetical protein Tco_0893189 [Tanacetum coccineum]|uniref:Reverse transcriptase domain-containing protein n=1 Tax=Tanacetum coccineum TaxID=301880 RepID=A0ABQ5CAU1_9ASTR